MRRLWATPPAAAKSRAISAGTAPSASRKQSSSLRCPPLRAHSKDRMVSTASVATDPTRTLTIFGIQALQWIKCNILGCHTCAATAGIVLVDGQLRHRDQGITKLPSVWSVAPREVARSKTMSSALQPSLGAQNLHQQGLNRKGLPTLPFALQPNFTGRGTNHRETKYAIVAVANKSFHKALPLIGRLRPKYRLHRQPCNAGEDTLAFRFAFAKPYVSERGIGEHAIWNQPIAGAAISSCETVTYDSKVVFGYV